MDKEKMISQSELDKIFYKELKSRKKEGIQEMLEKKRGGSLAGEVRTIFLSHNHEDKTIVSKIGLLFDKLNAQLYIDWMDKALPKTTDQVTASSIKAKIHTSHRFLFLATARGLQSKWCNWELGVADTLKKEDELAILPIKSKSGNWIGSEYLMLYPEMRFNTEDWDLLTIDDISIHKPNGDFVSLENWLQH